MQLKIITREAKNSDIYIVLRRLKDECPPSKYGEIVRQQAIHIYNEYRQEFNDMIKRLNCIPTASVQCFESILKKLFANNRYHWRRVVTVYTFALALAIYLEEHGMCLNELHKFGNKIGGCYV